LSSFYPAIIALPRTKLFARKTSHAKRLSVFPRRQHLLSGLSSSTTMRRAPESISLLTTKSIISRWRAHHHHAARHDGSSRHDVTSGVTVLRSSCQLSSRTKRNPITHDQVQLGYSSATANSLASISSEPPLDNAISNSFKRRLAALKSRVSNPSVNRSYTARSRRCASSLRPWRAQR
jgi:hypothetical protein